MDLPGHSYTPDKQMHLTQPTQYGMSTKYSAPNYMSMLRNNPMACSMGYTESMTPWWQNHLGGIGISNEAVAANIPSCCTYQDSNMTHPIQSHPSSTDIHESKAMDLAYAQSQASQARYCHSTVNAPVVQNIPYNQNRNFIDGNTYTPSRGSTLNESQAAKQFLSQNNNYDQYEACNYSRPINRFVPPPPYNNGIPQHQTKKVNYQDKLNIRVPPYKDVNFPMLMDPYSTYSSIPALSVYRPSLSNQTELCNKVSQQCNQPNNISYDRNAHNVPRQYQKMQSPNTYLTSKHPYSPYSERYPSTNMEWPNKSGIKYSAGNSAVFEKPVAILNNGNNPYVTNYSYNTSDQSNNFAQSAISQPYQMHLTRGPIRNEVPSYRQPSHQLSRHMNYARGCMESISYPPDIYSPNVISPTDSNTSDNSLSNTGSYKQGLYDDGGYVSRCSTASSIGSVVGVETDAHYKLQAQRGLPSNVMHRASDHIMNYENMCSGDFERYIDTSFLKKHPNVAVSNAKEQSQLDVRKFLSTWEDIDEEVGNVGHNRPGTPCRMSCDNPSTKDINTKISEQPSTEQLYILESVNISTEDLDKYKHVTQITKLPENIQGYNVTKPNPIINNQCNMRVPTDYHTNAPDFGQRRPAPASASSKRYKDNNIPFQYQQPPSPVDVEDVISQSVISKEAACNFEIKPFTTQNILINALSSGNNNSCLTAVNNGDNSIKTSPPKLENPIKMKNDKNHRAPEYKRPRQMLEVGVQTQNIERLDQKHSKSPKENILADISVPNIQLLQNAVLDAPKQETSVGCITVSNPVLDVSKQDSRCRYKIDKNQLLTFPLTDEEQHINIGCRQRSTLNCDVFENSEQYANMEVEENSDQVPAIDKNNSIEIHSINKSPEILAPMLMESHPLESVEEPGISPIMKNCSVVAECISRETYCKDSNKLLNQLLSNGRTNVTATDHITETQICNTSVITPNSCTVIVENHFRQKISCKRKSTTVHDVEIMDLNLDDSFAKICSKSVQCLSPIPDSPCYNTTSPIPAPIPLSTLLISKSISSPMLSPINLSIPSTVCNSIDSPVPLLIPPPTTLSMISESIPSKISSMISSSIPSSVSPIPLPTPKSISESISSTIPVHDHDPSIVFESIPSPSVIPESISSPIPSLNTLSASIIKPKIASTNSVISNLMSSQKPSPITTPSENSELIPTPVPSVISSPIPVLNQSTQSVDIGFMPSSIPFTPVISEPILSQTLSQIPLSTSVISELISSPTPSPSSLPTPAVDTELITAPIISPISVSAAVIDVSILTPTPSLIPLSTPVIDESILSPTPSPIPLSTPAIDESIVSPAPSSPISLSTPVIDESIVAPAQSSPIPLSTPVIDKSILSPTPSPIPLSTPVIDESILSPAPSPLPLTTPVIDESILSPAPSPIPLSTPVIDESIFSPTPSPIPLSIPVINESILSPSPIPLSTPVIDESILSPTPIPLSTLVIDKSIFSPTPIPLSTPVIEESIISPTPIPLSTPLIDKSPLSPTPSPIPLSTPVIGESILSPTLIPLSTPVIDKSPLSPTPSPIPLSTPVIGESILSPTPIPLSTPVIDESILSPTPSPIPLSTPVIDESILSTTPSQIPLSTPLISESITSPLSPTNPLSSSSGDIELIQSPIPLSISGISESVPSPVPSLTPLSAPVISESVSSPDMSPVPLYTPSVFSSPIPSTFPIQLIAAPALSHEESDTLSRPVTPGGNLNFDILNQVHLNLGRRSLDFYPDSGDLKKKIKLDHKKLSRSASEPCLAFCFSKSDPILEPISNNHLDSNFTPDIQKKQFSLSQLTTAVAHTEDNILEVGKCCTINEFSSGMLNSAIEETILEEPDDTDVLLDVETNACKVMCQVEENTFCDSESGEQEMCTSPISFVIEKEDDAEINILEMQDMVDDEEVEKENDAEINILEMQDMVDEDMVDMGDTLLVFEDNLILIPNYELQFTDGFECASEFNKIVKPNYESDLVENDSESLNESDLLFTEAATALRDIESEEVNNWPYIEEVVIGEDSPIEEEIDKPRNTNARTKTGRSNNLKKNMHKAKSLHHKSFVVMKKNLGSISRQNKNRKICDPTGYKNKSTETLKSDISSNNTRSVPTLTLLRAKQNDVTIDEIVLNKEEYKIDVESQKIHRNCNKLMEPNKINIDCNIGTTKLCNDANYFYDTQHSLYNVPQVKNDEFDILSRRYSESTINKKSVQKRVYRQSSDQDKNSKHQKIRDRTSSYVSKTKPIPKVIIKNIQEPNGYRRIMIDGNSNNIHHISSHSDSIGMANDFKVKLPLNNNHSVCKIRHKKIVYDSCCRAPGKGSAHARFKKSKNFDDVLNSIDKIQYNCSKNKSQSHGRSSDFIPKILIKRDDAGSHYTSSATSSSFNATKDNICTKTSQLSVMLKRNKCIEKLVRNRNCKVKVLPNDKILLTETQSLKCTIQLDNKTKLSLPHLLCNKTNYKTSSALKKKYQMLKQAEYFLNL